MSVNSKAKVAIILSTFNGERYVLQLLDSICNQTHQSFSLYIRDDGSSDKTVELVSDYKNKIDICFEPGKHIGVIDSFLQLLCKASQLSDIDYIAFCDQDDIWKEDKIERAVTALSKIDTGPALYHADYDIVNSDLELMKSSAAHLNTTAKTCFKNAVVQNIIPGFTAVINREAAVMISMNCPCPDKIVMHDWWVYLAVSAFGTIVWDTKATAFYRRHDNNTMGTKISKLIFWKNRINRYFTKKAHLPPLAIQAREFKKCFATIMDDKIENVLTDFIEACTGKCHDRIRYSIYGKTYFQTRFDNFVFKLLILFEIR